MVLGVIFTLEGIWSLRQTFAKNAPQCAARSTVCGVLHTSCNTKCWCFVSDHSLDLMLFCVCWKLDIMISVHCGSKSPRKSTIRPKKCRLLLLPISSERVVEHLPAQDPTTHWGFQRRLPPLFSSSPARYSLLHRSSHPLTFLSHLVSSFELFIVLTKARVEFLKWNIFQMFIIEKVNRPSSFLN